MNMKTTFNKEKVKNILNNWREEELLITKKQNRDTDHATIKLGTAAFHQRSPSIDGYVSPFVLQLHGKGNVQINESQKEPIPYLTYDIPLDGSYKVDYGNGQLTIKTDEQTFTIEPKHDE